MPFFVKLIIFWSIGCIITLLLNKVITKKSLKEIYGGALRNFSDLAVVGFNLRTFLGWPILLGFTIYIGVLLLRRNR